MWAQKQRNTHEPRETFALLLWRCPGPLFHPCAAGAVNRQDICTTIPSFASACPAYCGECGNIADEVTFAVVAIVIIVSAALCGIGFAIFAAKTRERRLAASETGVKERLQPGGKTRNSLVTSKHNSTILIVFVHSIVRLIFGLSQAVSDGSLPQVSVQRYSCHVFM